MVVHHPGGKGWAWLVIAGQDIAGMGVRPGFLAAIREADRMVSALGRGG